MNKTILSSAAILAATLTVHGTACGQAFDIVRLSPAGTGLQISAGLLGLQSREFAGGSRNESRALPVLDAQWSNGWFAGTTSGVGINLSRTPGLAYGVRLTADLGRKASDSIELRGLGDIDAAAEVGGFANWQVTDSLSVVSSLRYGSGNEKDGLVAHLGASHRLALAEDWSLGTQLVVSVANKEAMRSYFGVTATQSAASGLAAYTPSAGLRDARFGVTLMHRWSPQVSLMLSASITRLLGDAGDSPVVRDKGYPSFIGGVTYSF
jgi:MipA family protein